MVLVTADTTHCPPSKGGRLDMPGAEALRTVHTIPWSIDV